MTYCLDGEAVRHPGGMATRRKRKSPQLEAAKKIIRAHTTRGAQRSVTVQKAVERKGISVRTYRTARKQMRTLAIRYTRRNAARGRGTWYVKSR